MGRRSDGGQSSLLVVLVLVVVLVAVAVAGGVGGLAVDRSRARTAADAAALAAVAGGAPAARDVAARNGAEVRAVVQDGDEVEVTVRVGRVEATSRAGPG